MLLPVTEADEQQEQQEKEEKTDADVSAARKVQKAEEEWGEDDATEVDARPPVDTPPDPHTPR
jgi:hypothetical protein